MARLIETDPISVSRALKDSGSFIENPYNKRELVDKVAYAIANNESFKYSIAFLIAKNSEYLNIGGGGKVDWEEELAYGAGAIGEGAAGGAQQGGWVGAIVGAVIGNIDAVFHAGASKKKALTKEEIAKQQLISELYDDKKKSTAIVPILIISGVLLVGGIITFLALRE